MNLTLLMTTPAATLISAIELEGRKVCVGQSVSVNQLSSYICCLSSSAMQGRGTDHDPLFLFLLIQMIIFLKIQIYFHSSRKTPTGKLLPVVFKAGIVSQSDEAWGKMLQSVNVRSLMWSIGNCVQNGMLPLYV